MSYQVLFVDAIAIFHPKRYGYKELNEIDETKLFELFRQAIKYVTGHTVSQCRFKSWPSNFGYTIECGILFAGTIHRLRIALSTEELKQSYMIKRTKDDLKYKLYLHIGQMCQKKEVY